MSEAARPPTRWVEWTPARPWADFDAHQALSDAIWDSASEPEWHYLNPAGGLSIWEARTDGSAILIEYRDDRIVALQTNSGDAQRHLLAVAAPFRLVAGARADSSPRTATTDTQPT
ncbi:hypothetical protein [Lysobacter sp. Root690]|uniref:hypothetical protein n=1 Tax=Lysobacter sp. Root690 TaxID=1736588 RepID=UPI0006F1EE65|nr:hypothetical protein [Lysobacter sp. Root690]KRB08617.1 hypothetical protein ASD86_04625 [Lysobacter sp. Root690]